MAKSSKKEEKQSFADEAIAFVKTLLWAIVVVMFINGLLIASFVVPTPSMERTVMTGDFLFVNRFIYGPTSPQIVPFLNLELPYIKIPGIWEPEVGDVIVFVYPGNRDDVEPHEFQYYLKRCSGVAGDTVQVKNKQLYVNGKAITFPETGVYIWEKEERPANFPYGTTWTMDNYGPIRIPKEGDKLNLNTQNIREWETIIRREGHEVSYDSQSVYIDGKATTTYTIEQDYCFGMGDNRDNSSDSRDWGFIPKENVVGTPMIVYWSWDTNAPMKNIGDKISSIRWDRLGTIIR